VVLRAVLSLGTWSRKTKVPKLALLRVGRESGVRESVDRIFGFFGQLQADCRDAIVGGYTRKEREEHWNTYISVAKYEINTVSSFGILSLVKLEDRHTMLPS
jgi:hypothetical protein